MTIQTTVRPQTPRAAEPGAQSVPPGGTLVSRMTDDPETWRRHVATLPSPTLNERQFSDLDLITDGAFSPLTGFMSHDDEGVVTSMRLANGLVWSIPVTLAVAAADAPTIGTEVARHDAEGMARGAMRVEDVYDYDKKREAREETIDSLLLQMPPPEFSRPEVAQILIDSMRGVVAKAE